MLKTVPGTFVEHFVSVISGWYIFYNKWDRPLSMRAIREGLLEETAFNVRPERWEWSKHVNNWGSKSQRQKKEHLVSPRGRKEISGERGWRTEHGMSWGPWSRQPGKEFGFYSSSRVEEWHALCFKKSHSAAVQRINCKGESWETREKHGLVEALVGGLEEESEDPWAAVYSFPRSARTNSHKLGVLKQQKFILL